MAQLQTVTPISASAPDTQAFTQRLIEVINDAGLAMMISIGHRTRLFDTMASLPPATSHQIANAANLDERYVREWLGAMTTARVIEYHPAQQTYRLPPEHAALLTRAASPNNMAVTMQFVAVLGRVEDRIVECFHHGGGVPYSEYPRFHDVMAEESNQTTVAGLLEHILPLAPDLRRQLEHGIDVLDVGCGIGQAMIHLAAAFPRSRFAGYDFSEQAIARARLESQRRALGNIHFEPRDVTVIGQPNRYDLITAFDAIHDQMHPGKVLAQIHEALKPTGLFLMQDIHASSHVEKNLDIPLATFTYTISTMHCMTVSLAGCGCGLGAAWGQELAQHMLRQAGFRDLSVHTLPHDILNTYYLARPSK